MPADLVSIDEPRHKSAPTDAPRLTESIENPPEEPSATTAAVEMWLPKHLAGDSTARDALVSAVLDRLRRLAEFMLRGYPKVIIFEEAEDVAQSAALRLYKALQEVRPPTARDFFRFVVCIMRRVLLDLADKYANRPAPGLPADGSRSVADQPGSTADPISLLFWTEFHGAVERLPDDLREVFELRWYHGHGPGEIAVMLKVEPVTVRRRWHKAVLALRRMLGLTADRSN